MQTPGKLIVIGTPIGNLEDLTLRALRTLREVDLIAAEDTRLTGRLLQRYEIRKPLVSYHEFNEARRTPELTRRLQAGARIALVSDAGMPMVSDPGQRLVDQVLRLGLPLEIVPGPSAITMGVAASGLVDGPFLFYGFLPHKGAQRRKVLQQLAGLDYPIVFFESPHRVIKSLTDMLDCLGNRRACLGRELTKKFEEIQRAELSALLKSLVSRSIKGEITVVVEGATT